jgi:hypothetical protein
LDKQTKTGGTITKVIVNSCVGDVHIWPIRHDSTLSLILIQYTAQSLKIQTEKAFYYGHIGWFKFIIYVI